MPLMAVLLIGASQLLHLGWNTQSRAERGESGFMWSMVSWAGILSGAAAIPEWSGIRWVMAWPWIAGTLATHTLYFPGVARVYKLGEMSDGYPLMRGGSALLAALVAAVILHQRLGLIGWAGLVGVASGLWLLVGRPGLPRSPERLLAVLIVMGAITGYSLVDSQAMRVVPAIPYMALIGLGTGLTLLPWARPRRWWPDFRALPAGAMTAASYILLLAAYPLAPLGAVLALRQVAPALAPLVGAARLGEPWSWLRAGAAALIAGGAAALVWH